jgi:hypothetical protein
VTDETWEDRNMAYLGASLRWLRERLTALAPPEAAPAPEPRPVPADDSVPLADRPGCVPWMRRRPAAPGQVPTPAPAPRPASLPPSSVPRPQEATAVAFGEPPVAPVEVSLRAGLSPFEADVLLLAAAAELDPHIRHLCARANPDGLPHPTFGLSMRLFDEPSWAALAPNAPLRRLLLLTVADEGGTVNAPIRADERVVNFLKGLDHLDERLARLLVGMDTGGMSLTPSQAGLVDAVEQRARAADGPVVVNLVGPDSATKRVVAEHAAARLGRHPVRVPAANLGGGTDLDFLARLWDRESLLSPLALFLDASDEGGEAGPDGRAGVERLLSRLRGLVFLDSREVWPNPRPGLLVLDVSRPTTAEQREEWTAALPPGDTDMAADLAAQFDLDLHAIHLLAAECAATPAGPDRRRQLWRAALRSARPRLDLLAQRVEAKATSEDLVVPPDVREQLDRIKDQVRHRSVVHSDWGLGDRSTRGLGITALFAGESGTGKTLAAEVIAAELDLNLYRVDLSAVVSKFIGETEKNLCRLFDGAERGGTILFFDEADALFGKRSEVKDSHDRYANIEVNYLLQRMEGYQGLAILATNMKSALDQAFARRLRFVVDFPFPEAAERERIWRRAFVEKVHTDALDLTHLARLTLTGGSINTVAVNATFAAAATPDRVLTMPMVLAAARVEYRKLGLSLNEADFRWEQPVLAEAVR